MSHVYVIALGSNVRVAGVGLPRRVLTQALRALEDEGVTVRAASPIMDSAPVGPSLRRYANGAAIVETDQTPPDLMVSLQRIERRFGRTRAQRRGQRWRARALDLDIILWSGGRWESATLSIPHREMSGRDFVLRTVAAIARNWRCPATGLTVSHFLARLLRPRPVRKQKRALNRTRG